MKRAILLSATLATACLPPNPPPRLDPPDCPAPARRQWGGFPREPFASREDDGFLIPPINDDNAGHPWAGEIEAGSERQ